MLDAGVLLLTSCVAPRVACSTSSPQEREKGAEPSSIIIICFKPDWDLITYSQVITIFVHSRRIIDDILLIFQILGAK
jgi:hypothetical protein